jgi:hypothetical protein
MRKTQRHNAHIPVEIEREDGGELLSHASIASISAGGLMFRASGPVAEGIALKLTLADSWPCYVTRGECVWCRSVGDLYEVGVEFHHPNESFKARMLAQFGQIEDYRQRVELNEGRQLSRDEAAQEWIGLYAELFDEAVGWQ